MEMIGIEMQKPIKQLLSFVRYMYWSERMRAGFLDQEFYPPTLEGDADSGEWNWFARISYWMASLFVVTEAWERIGYQDPIVDSLLSHADGYKDALRRYRNCVFHYQEDLADPRLLSVFNSEGALEWVCALHDEFNRFVLREIEELVGSPEEIKELKELVRAGVGWFPSKSPEMRRLEETLGEARGILESAGQDDFEGSQALHDEIRSGIESGVRSLDEGEQKIEDFRAERLRRLGVIGF